MRCLNKFNLIYYDHVMMCNKFEMFLIKILFFNSYFRIETLIFCFLSFEGWGSYSKSMITSLATGRGIL